MAYRNMTMMFRTSVHSICPGKWFKNPQLLKPEFKFTILTKSNTRNFSMPNQSQLTLQIAEIITEIQRGHRIMVLMRGASGSGKSHFARHIVDATMNGDYKSHICSADNFFFDESTKEYMFRPESLPEAHSACQLQAISRMKEDLSPVIIDNTNIRVWEMMPYVQSAVIGGYLIKILEARNAWSHSSAELANRNMHGVPEKAIQKMLLDYEQITVDQLLALCDVKYQQQLPVLRDKPPI